ncbi:hypothetical protein SAMD00019534_081710 [Acytostelium subglobosum LB1]|uniref:hypothetical protein n=1 Tax=Acytostelium subglobosum LB1 TaxID=1410327 RepID=UPI000644CD10|nr:hypothetical protein SAMD00019534_081710 [Acytostelium subglobosum LB1]GAM24996.1 hypothetical protein SAMD00019534_081710 [Acytostelium subglobosum LB1]|eukprot:XP_012752085.1 hypothetical protein SAMD00019534_081710 [Acytostelium subglobosum LB1]
MIGIEDFEKKLDRDQDSLLMHEEDLNQSTDSSIHSSILSSSNYDDQSKDKEPLVSSPKTPGSNRSSPTGSTRRNGEVKEVKFMNEKSYLVEQQTQDEVKDNTKSVPTGKWRSVLFYLCLSSFWLGHAAINSSLTSVLYPKQIAYMVGDEEKERYLGQLPIYGAAISIVMAPLAGALSDHCKSRFGRRRIFIFFGVIICCGFLILSIFPGKHIYWFMLCTVGVQLGGQLADGPYTGLTPDVVPKEQYGKASGYLAFSMAIGNLLGLSGTGIMFWNTKNDGETPAEPPFAQVYSFLVVVLVLFTVPTLIGVPEKRLTGQVPKFTLKRFFMSFYLPSSQYRNFYWVIITRFFQEMGIYSILQFFQYYLEDVIKVENATFYTTVLLCIIVVTSVPTSIVAGPLSDRFGRKVCVYISSAAMALCTLGFMLLSFRPSLTITLVMGAFFGMGYGAYQAVDWALALDVLPENADVAKDMGIWHQAFVIPSVLAPFITGMVIDSLHVKYSYQIAYTVVFSMTIFWFTMATVMIKPIRIENRSGKDNFIRLHAVDDDDNKSTSSTPTGA